MAKVMNFVIGTVIVLGGLAVIRIINKPKNTKEIRIAKEPITLTSPR